MCEVWIYRNTLVTPGICPFCVGQKQLPAATRYHQHSESWRLWRHVDRHLRDTHWPGPCPHPLCKLVLKDAEDFDCHMIDFHGKDIVLRNSSKRKFEDKPTKSEGSIEAEVLTRLGTDRGYQIPTWAYRPRKRTAANRPPPYQGMHTFQATDPGLTIDTALAYASANLLVGHSQASSLTNQTEQYGSGSERTKTTSETQLRGQGNDEKAGSGYHPSLHPEDSHCSLVSVPYGEFAQGQAAQRSDRQQSFGGNIERPLSSSPEEVSNSSMGSYPSSPSWNGFEDDDCFDEDKMGAMIV